MKISITITNLSVGIDLTDQGPMPVKLTCSTIQAELESAEGEPKFEAWREELAKALRPIGDHLRQWTESGNP